MPGADEATTREGTMQRAPLFERDHLLRELRDRFAAAGRGDGSLVFLAGEAGAGKTSVVEEFVGQVRHRATVLSGACDPLTTPRPLSPLLDIAADPASGLPDLTRDRSGPTAWFGTLIDRLKAGRPTIIVLEDVHWADDATLDFLRFTGRRIVDTNALLLCTYRDDELRRHHPLLVALGDLATRGSTIELTVKPLSEAAVREMVQDRPVDPQHLHGLTGGNPFYVTEVLATGQDIPRSVQEEQLNRRRLVDGLRTDYEGEQPPPLEVLISVTLSDIGTTGFAAPRSYTSDATETVRVFRNGPCEGVATYQLTFDTT